MKSIYRFLTLKQIKARYEVRSSEGRNEGEKSPNREVSSQTASYNSTCGYNSMGRCYNCFPLDLGAAAASVSCWVTLWPTRVCLSSNYWTDFSITCCRSLGTARASFGTDVEGELWFELQLWGERKIKLPRLGEVR